MSRELDKIVEKVPDRFIHRIGDWVQEGGNNTLLIMGTDRPGAPNTGLGHLDAEGGGKGTGTIHAIAGRKSSDPDFATDASFIYISEKTKVDENLNTKGVGPKDQAKASPAIAIKSDNVRVVGRESLKISIDGGAAYVFIDKDTIELKIGSSVVTATKDKIVVEGGTIELGKGAKQPVILGNEFANLCFDKHTHPTAVGTSGPPTPSFSIAANKQKVLSQQTFAKDKK